MNRTVDIPGRVLFLSPETLLSRGAVPILHGPGTPVEGPHYFLAFGFGETPTGRVGVWAPLFSRASGPTRVLLDPAAQAGYWKRNRRDTCVDTRQFWIVPTGTLTLRRDYLPDSYALDTLPVAVEYAARHALARYRLACAQAPAPTRKAA